MRDELSDFGQSRPRQACSLLDRVAMDELQDLVARFCAAWNRHDADALARLWTDDGELNHPWGRRAVGRDAILGVLREEHAGSMSASELQVVHGAASTTSRSPTSTAFCAT
ncbi:MAG: nuclear transport factor 2 family protein [Acidobacteria bacterium]|nr:nuclear transport factor 2 family protein [Acidobacteriota bacterium]